jgi:serine/threonine protein kinase
MNINYTFQFKGIINIPISEKGETELGELIKKYFKKIEKSNLLTNNIDNIYFIYNGVIIKKEDYTKKLCDYFYFPEGNLIEAINSFNKKLDYEIESEIKTNNYTGVYKAKLKDTLEYVAVKKIFKEKIKEEMIFSLGKLEITEEDFKPEVEKFNKEIQNMEKCSCENSVKIYDYYDTENEFIIIMELCDETLFHMLIRKTKGKKTGFCAEEIKGILLQLNNVFRKMNYYNISHRDIKLNNILVKYLDKERNRYKVLLSDYGISNQLMSITKKLSTHAGSHLIMAPEILNNEKYTNKCDLWSLGVNIYQMYTKQFPYISNVEKGILDLIEKNKQTILDVIEDGKLKDLLSKLLVRNPDNRISWEEYFEHPFFK